MKKLIPLTPLLLFFLFVLSACSSDEQELIPSILNIDQEKSEVNILYNVTTAKIIIESNTDWQASFKEEITFASFEKENITHKIEGKQESEVLIYFTENVENQERNITIRFSTNDGLSKEVIITQGQAPSEIVLYKNSLHTSDEWINPNGVGSFDANGLKITETGLDNTLLLNRHYSLNKRLVRHRVQFGADSRMLFLAKETYRHVNMGTITEVDVAAKKLKIYHAFNAQKNILPIEKASIDIPFNIDPAKVYIVELVRDNKKIE